MRDSKGKPFSSKFAGDAEGLAVQGGVALVSFETDPRVLAYDVEHVALLRGVSRLAGTWAMRSRART
jgi:hypothetical protein